MPCFNFEKIGSGENKIVCIHGFGASRKTFYDILPFLKHNYEIYLIDLIGFGDSKFEKNWDYTIENQMKLLYSFLKEKKLINVTVIGHSYGGGVVLFLLNLLRDLNEENIIKNAVLFGPACYPQKIPFFIRIPADHPFLYKLFMFLVPKKILAKNMLKNLYINKNLINDEKIERYASYFRKTDNINAIIKTAQKILPDNVDEITNKIKFIKTKTLIIWGENDFVIKKQHILKLHGDIKGSKLVIVKRTGHVVQEEQPELVAEEVSALINN